MKSPELRVSARNGYYGDAEGGAGTPGARISVSPERKNELRAGEVSTPQQGGQIRARPGADV